MCTSMDRQSVIQCCQTCCLKGCELRRYQTTNTPTTVPTVAPTPSPPTCTDCYHEPADVVFVTAGSSSSAEHTARIRFVKTIINEIIENIKLSTIRVAHVSHITAGTIRYSDFVDTTSNPTSQVNTLSGKRPALEICAYDPDNSTICNTDARIIVRQTTDFVLNPLSTTSGFRMFNVPTYLIVLGNEGGNHYVVDQFQQAYANITSITYQPVMLDEFGLDDASTRADILNMLCSGNRSCAPGLFESEPCNATNDRVCDVVTNCTCGVDVANCTLIEASATNDAVCDIDVTAASGSDASLSSDQTMALYIVLVLFILMLLIVVIVLVRRNSRKQHKHIVTINNFHDKPYHIAMEERLPSPVLTYNTTNGAQPTVQMQAAEDSKLPGQFSANGQPLDIYFTITDTTDGGPPVDIEIVPDHQYQGPVHIPLEEAAIYTIQAVSYQDGRLRSPHAFKNVTVLPAPLPIFSQLAEGGVQIEVPDGGEVLYSVAGIQQSAIPRALRITSTAIVLTPEEAKLGVKVSAKSLKKGCAPSDTVEFQVQAIAIATPRIVFEKLQDSSNEGVESFQISIACGTEGATVYYTVLPISNTDREIETETERQRDRETNIHVNNNTNSHHTVNSKTKSPYDTVAFVKHDGAVGNPTSLKNMGGDVVKYNAADRPVVAVSEGSRLRVKAYATKVGQSSQLAVAESSVPKAPRETPRRESLPGEVLQVSTVTTVLKPGEGGWLASFACETPDVEIFFTTDGSEIGPYSRTARAGASNVIEASHGHQAVCIKAQATKDGMLPSATTSLRMHLEQCGEVGIVLEPLDGNSDAWSLSFDCATEGATICFTTDDSVVNINSKGVSAKTLLTLLPALDEPMKVRAIAKKYGMTPSAETMREACVTEKTAAPTVEVQPVRGSDEEFELVLESATRGAEIYYTLNGSKIEHGTLYNPNFKPTFVPELGVSMNIQCRATMPGMLTSEVVMKQGSMEDSEDDVNDEDSPSPPRRQRSSTIVYGKVQELLRKVLESDFDGGDDFVLNQHELEELFETDHLREMLPQHLSKHLQTGSHYAVANAATLMDMVDKNHDGTIRVSEFLNIYTTMRNSTTPTSISLDRQRSSSSITGYPKKYVAPPGYLSSEDSHHEQPLYDFANPNEVHERPDAFVPQDFPDYDFASNVIPAQEPERPISLCTLTRRTKMQPPIIPKRKREKERETKREREKERITVLKIPPKGNSDEWQFEINCNTSGVRVNSIFRFTTDGSEVTETSDAIAVNTPYHFTPKLGVPFEISAVAEIDGVLQFNTECQTMVELEHQVAQPSMTAVSTLQDNTSGFLMAGKSDMASKSNELELTMKCMTPGAQIYYVVNGDITNTTEAREYHSEMKPIIVPLPDQPIKVTSRAILPGMASSDICNETYEAKFKNREVRVMRKETVRGKLAVEQFMAFGTPKNFVNESPPKPRMIATQEFSEVVPIDSVDSDDGSVKVIDVNDFKKKKRPLSRSGSGKDLLLLMAEKGRRNEAAELALENKARAKKRASRVADLTGHLSGRLSQDKLYQFALSEENESCNVCSE